MFHLGILRKTKPSNRELRSYILIYYIFNMCCVVRFDCLFVSGYINGKSNRSSLLENENEKETLPTTPRNVN